ncbi:MAG: 2,3-bisphosphoglycerate-independent phosphoglycerate mutase [Flavobacteriales bacterium]|nr:2,3-bisphosphoglycerate-independent phosphoglycerate mutase [Flavobacteriales bacterium]
MQKKVLLMILDGWGHSPDPSVSAVDQANTPFIDSLYQNYPSATLRTDGLHVGLPDGQMGNSEVGHMNLGAGRIVYQELTRINLALQNQTLAKEKSLQDAFSYAKDNHKKVHFLGLVSNGGVHSHISHLKGLVEAAHQFGLTDCYLHAFTDGRDVDPKASLQDLQELLPVLEKNQTKLASLIGRYYAMDRDKRWERVKLAYDLLVHGKGTPTKDILKSVQESYDNQITDEFIAPLVITNEQQQPLATIAPDDVVIFFNFRTDRGRELTEVLSQKDFPEFDMKALPLYYVTMTNYDETYQNVKVIYNKDNLTNTIGEVISNAGKKQIRIAETEKYPHVTFFFSGGREETFEGETRILRASPKVATYDLKPEMSAYELRDALLPELANETADFICLNFANGDMVGHTGVMEAAIQACEAVDVCVKDLIETALAHQYTTIVIADHGNCETMKNPDGSPNTAHTTNPVPIIVVDNEIKEVKSGVLGNIAPTILHLMGIEKPEEMDLESLV